MSELLLPPQPIHTAPEDLAEPLTRHETVLYEQFEDGLEDCKPYMFHMAEQVLEDYPNRQWDVIIGDDTSGRLPARFTRLIFEKFGVDIPTRYIAGSASVSKDKPAETYDTYVENILGNLTDDQGQPIENPRALIVTESGGTFRSLSILHGMLGKKCSEIDTAIVAAKQEPPADLDLGHVYIGGVGSQAMAAVWRTFENPATGSRLSRNKLVNHFMYKRYVASSAALTNLEKNFDPESGDARISDSTKYRRLAAHCYARMSTLADEAYQHLQASNVV